MFSFISRGIGRIELRWRRLFDWLHFNRLIELPPILDRLPPVPAFFDIVERDLLAAEQRRLDLAQIPPVTALAIVSRVAVAIGFAALFIKPVLPGMDALHFFEGLTPIFEGFGTANVALAVQLIFDLSQLGEI